MSNIDFSKVVTAAARIEQDRAKALAKLADILAVCHGGRGAAGRSAYTGR